MYNVLRICRTYESFGKPCYYLRVEMCGACFTIESDYLTVKVLHQIYYNLGISLWMETTRPNYKPSHINKRVHTRWCKKFNASLDRTVHQRHISRNSLLLFLCVYSELINLTLQSLCLSFFGQYIYTQNVVNKQ